MTNISWSDGGGTLNPSPAYGCEANLDTTNDHGLEQLVTETTRGNNVLDLIICSHPHNIHDINIIPGISDHEALLFYLNSQSRAIVDEIKHSIFCLTKVI